LTGNGDDNSKLQTAPGSEAVAIFGAVFGAVVVAGQASNVKRQASLPSAAQE
jgi:hypothetical protein